MWNNTHGWSCVEDLSVTQSKQQSWTASVTPYCWRRTNTGGNDNNGFYNNEMNTAF